MNKAILAIVSVVGMVAHTHCASAQAGLATSSSVGGHNTVQQAPSGGRVGGAGTPAAMGQDSGKPTAEERQIEQHNNAASQICKGC